MQSTRERIQGVQKSPPLFIIIISRVTKQAGSDRFCANKSMFPLFPSSLRRNAGGSPIPHCAQCCGNIKEGGGGGLEDCDEGSSARREQLEKVSLVPKKIPNSRASRPYRIISYHVLALPAPRASFPFPLPCGTRLTAIAHMFDQERHR